MIFLGIDTVPLGVDLEIVKPRGEEVFSLHTELEYQLIGGKNWENFYRLRTIKESVIKLNLSDIAEIVHITLTHVVKQDSKREEIDFDMQIQGTFLGKSYLCCT
ncbi:MAG: hypothetical protein LBG52_08210 [Candidatus Peribacteria bacterium]|nr:hypothetical protein [Candidatus Peribacteria bacterium]